MMLCCQYSAKKPAERGLQYQYNASFFICISLPAVRTYFSMKPLGIRLHHSSLKRSSSYVTIKITFYHNCLEDSLTFRNMACNIWKYCWSRLLPSDELTYQINVTENESIPRRWEWWTRCQATNLWRSLALQLIHFTPVVTFAQHDMA